MLWKSKETSFFLVWFISAEWGAKKTIMVKFEIAAKCIRSAIQFEVYASSSRKLFLLTEKIIVLSFFRFFLKLILLNLYLPGRYSSNIRQSALNWCVFLSPFLSCIISGCKFPFCTKWSIFWKWQWSTVKAINLSLIMLFNRSWNNY